MKSIGLIMKPKVIPMTSALLFVLGILLAGGSYVIAATYTLNADFDQGTLINVNHDIPDQLQLKGMGEPFNFIWVAASARGTIIKIDTLTGEVLGEYLSAPAGRARNPSRTTVDANGNVWAGNRDETSGNKGSVVHIGLLENNQCVDRNGNGTIETSSGLGDIKPWANTGGVDNDGGVSSAGDECIIHYVRTAGTAVRTVAVDANNDVWVGGLNNTVHEKIDGATGLPVSGTQFSLGCGGYGGLVDANGVLWSSSSPSYTRLLRYNPTIPGGTCLNLPRVTYGLGIDTNGFIWNSNWTWNSILKIDPSGAPIYGPFPTGGASGDRGVTVTPADNNVWVANSYGSDVSRLDNNGTLLKVIQVGSTPTGLSVDAAGKVWVTNLGSNSVMRIDPNGGADGLGQVDLTVSLGSGAGPYNYSDMTGSTLTAPPDAGTWTIIHDSGISNARWGIVSWTANEPSGSSISVTAASSSDGLVFGTPENVSNGIDLTVANGQYLKVVVSFVRASTGDTPVLYDLTIAANLPPDCTQASASIDTIWPPNHNFVSIAIMGVTDPDGDPVNITIDSIYQDEPVDTLGDGSFAPDGQGIGSSIAEVRAESVGSPKVPGNGRFYHIGFTADDGMGGTCSGKVLVKVPHDKGNGHMAVDEGALYDSTLVE